MAKARKILNPFDGDEDYQLAQDYAAEVPREYLFCRTMRHTPNPALWPVDSEMAPDGGWIYSGPCIGCGGMIFRQFHPNGRPHKSWVKYRDGYLGVDIGRALTSKAGRAALNTAYYQG